MRLKPVNSIADLRTKDVGLATFWGVSKWEEYESRLLIRMPSVPMGNSSIAKKVGSLGIEAAVKQLHYCVIVLVVMVGALGMQLQDCQICQANPVYRSHNQIAESKQLLMDKVLPFGMNW